MKGGFAAPMQSQWPSYPRFRSAGTAARYFSVSLLVPCQRSRKCRAFGFFLRGGSSRTVPRAAARTAPAAGADAADGLRCAMKQQFFGLAGLLLLVWGRQAQCAGAVSAEVDA